MKGHCYVCGHRGRVQVHHVDWNHANDSGANRCPLCRACHAWVHENGVHDWEELREHRKACKAIAPERFTEDCLLGLEVEPSPPPKLGEGRSRGRHRAEALLTPQPVVGAESTGIAVGRRKGSGLHRDGDRP